MRLKQEGRVNDYVQEFEVLVAQAPHLTEEQLLGYFLGGLQMKVRNQIRPHDPKELLRAMEIVVDMDEAVNEEPKLSYGRSVYANVRCVARTGMSVRVDNNKGWNGKVGSSMGSNGRKDYNSGTKKTRTEANGGEVSRNRGTRTLPYSEYIKRREEGRCFQCGGPYIMGHRYPEKNLRVIIMGEEDDGLELEEPRMTEMGKKSLSEEDGWLELQCQGMELSLFSAGGMTQPNTMKLQGRMQEVSMLVLIDSGVSHNFISTRLVKKLGLRAENTPSYSVKLGDGHRKGASRCCRNLELELGNYPVKETFYLFELGAVDVILGVAWLAKLGK